ncbi:MAG: U32 family peptidase, partial [Oscillospiraceae bacterium]|nr:U32 family peptidase [Oscillospiraceae bacterium]
RVVLARELSLLEIENIAKNTKAELEVFVHGALCMSVSGQCYLSSMIGRRSGNRGLCAQPCRLPFGVNNPNECALSLKDLSGLSHIKKLAEIGVSSFKIEGRMKRPEYVASAVTAIKNVVENGSVSDYEIKRLRSVFSRSGFTDGYLTGQRYDMFGTRQKEDVTSAPQYLKELQSLYARDVARRKINLTAVIKKDNPFSLSAQSGDFSAEYIGDMPETALNKPTSPEMVEKSLAKLGGTPFYLEKINIDLDDGLVVPVSKLNEARRFIVEKLIEQILDKPTPKTYDYKPLSSAKISDEKPLLYGRFFEKNQIPKNADMLYKVIMPIFQIDEDIMKRFGTKLCAELPRAMFLDETQLRVKLHSLVRVGLTSCVCQNIAHLNLCEQAGVTALGGFSLNIANSESANIYANMGVSEITLSPEMLLTSIKRVNAPLKRGIVGYGYLPLMLTRNCPLKNTLGCKKCRGKGAYLTDRMGEKFFVRCTTNASEVFNSKPIYLADRLDELCGLSFITLYFTNESELECAEIISAYQNGGEKRDNITRGLYYRGAI